MSELSLQGIQLTEEDDHDITITVNASTVLVLRQDSDSNQDATLQGVT